MRLMSLTNCVIVNSLNWVIWLAMSAAGKPLNCQITVTIGSLIDGNTSFAMRMIASVPARMMTSATTMNVYGRRSESLTIHIDQILLFRTRDVSAEPGRDNHRGRSAGQGGVRKFLTAAAL